MSTPTQKLISRSDDVIDGVKFTVTIRLRKKGKWNCFETRYYVNSRQVKIGIFEGERKAALQREVTK
jgi:hypothetical protein